MSNRTQPAGVGNGYDLVGRYFTEHLSDSAATIRLTKHQRISHSVTADGRRVWASWDSIPSFAGERN
jgi:hypothetical protein